jgi:hypothetical protein
VSSVINMNAMFDLTALSPENGCAIHIAFSSNQI